jgi:hypothetical protein
LARKDGGRKSQITNAKAETKKESAKPETQKSTQVRKAGSFLAKQKMRGIGHR